MRGQGQSRWAAGAYPRYSRHLHIMRMDVTAVQWAEGLALLELHGVRPLDAGAVMYALLYRLTPYWATVQGWLPADPTPPMQTFQGWQPLKAELQQDMRGLDPDEREDFLRGAFGQDAMPLLWALLST